MGNDNIIAFRTREQLRKYLGIFSPQFKNNDGKWSFSGRCYSAYRPRATLENTEQNPLRLRKSRKALQWLGSLFKRWGYSSRPTFLLIRNKYVTLSPVTTNHLICAFLRRVIIQMKRLGLNQTQLAKRMKVSRPYVTKLLSGDVNITFGTAMRLAQALQMDFFPDLREKTEPEVAAVPSAT